MKNRSRLYGALALGAVTLALAAAVRFGAHGGKSVLAAQTATPENTAEAPQTVLAFMADSPYALVDGERRMLDTKASVTARLIADELTVPLRFMAEAYGAGISWSQPTKTATVELSGKSIAYSVDKAEMLVDGKSVKIPQAAVITDGRMYVPVRSFAEALGVKYVKDGQLAAVGEAGDISEFAQKLAALPVVGTKEKFAELMSGLDERRGYGTKQFAGGMGMVDIMFEAAESGGVAMNDGTAPMPAPTAAAPEAAVPQNESSRAAADTGAADYSTTNVQVEGVDEADIIKTDGEYIYYANNSKVWIVKAAPADAMKLVSTVTFPVDTGSSDGFNLSEMYVDGGELVAIGNAMRMFYVNGMRNYQSMTRAYVYDISDRAAPVKTREIESEGNYISSRKIGKAVYMLSGSWVYSMYEGVYPVPVYRDTAASDAYKEIGYDMLYYFPDFTVNNYLFVTGFEADKPKTEAKLSAYLGCGESVYVSTGSMYVAATEYPQYNASARIAMPSVSSPETAVYKFALSDGGVYYENKSSVPGTILNQFSMDEYDGHFRIATTDYDENYTQKNGLYILNDKLEITGSIEDIAPGERIYSTRFMGGRGYIVTFKNVDPLFVIDMNPTAPKILGALKIPGYSNYLHPYDENHLIGIGKDTVESKNGAYYLGMKLSMFDVTDVADPKELFVETIGDRGTESPVLSNHKALMFDKARGLMAFPISVAKLSAGQSAEWDYGQFEFQGAYVYNVDLVNGFTLKGGITHMTEQDMLKSGMYGYDYTKAVDRIIFIGDNLYTTSPELIKATGIADMKEAGSVELK